MLMPDGDRVSGAYRYGFNGKEQDSDFGGTEGAIYDYGFRIYDSRIAKFLSVDPLTKGYPWYTPYQFAGNKPIGAIDLDGKEEMWVVHWIVNSSIEAKVKNPDVNDTELMLLTPIFMVLNNPISQGVISGAMAPCPSG